MDISIINPIRSDRRILSESRQIFRQNLMRSPSRSHWNSTSQINLSRSHRNPIWIPLIFHINPIWIHWNRGVQWIFPWFRSDVPRIFFQKSVLNAEARKQASKRKASKQASKQASKWASKPDSQQASKQAKEGKEREGIFLLRIFLLFFPHLPAETAR